jgi:hypothetical protein
LVSVALANLLITVIALPCSCIEIMAVSPNHPDVCALQWFLTQLAAVVTLISFALISVENLLALSNASSLCSRLLCSKMRILLLLLLLWTFAIMLPWLRQLYRLTPDLCAPFVQPTSNQPSPSSTVNFTSLVQPVSSSSPSSASSSSSSLPSSSVSSSSPVPFSRRHLQQTPTTQSSVKSASLLQPSSSLPFATFNHSIGDTKQLGILWPRFHLVMFVCVLCIPHLISLLFFANCALRIKSIRQRSRASVNTDSYTHPSVTGDFALIKSNMLVSAYASVSWSPLIVCVFLSTFTGFSDANLISIAWWFAWTFSCLYSFVYALLNRDFGEAFFKLFFYCCCKSHVTFVRKSFTYRRPSVTNSLTANRRRTDLNGSGESYGLRVHIIPGLNMSQRRDTFGLISGGYGSSSGGGTSGHGLPTGILRSESLGRGNKTYGQTGGSSGSHHHIWSNAHKSSSGRNIYEKESESAFGAYRPMTSRGENDLPYRDQRHAMGFGRNFGSGNMSAAKFSCSSKYVSDL